MIGLVALAAPLGAQPEAVPYADDAERAAGWALLREPLAFDGAALSPLSAELLADQALTLAANPDLDVLLGVVGDDPALVEARIAALAEAFAAGGVGPGQIRFLPVTDSLLAGPAVRGDARIVGAEGGLAAGVLAVPYRIRAWRGAAVHILPRRLVTDDERVLCAPPFAARTDPPDGDGVVTGTYPRKTVVVVARDAERLVFRTHEMGATGPDEALDLSTLSHVPLCDAP